MADCGGVGCIIIVSSVGLGWGLLMVESGYKEEAQL